MTIVIINSKICAGIAYPVLFTTIFLAPFICGCNKPTEKFKTWEQPTIKYSLNLIPDGNFNSGFCAGNQVFGSNKVESFWMGVTEVTQEQWKLIMGDFELHPEKPSPFWGVDSNFPKVSISHHDIERFLDSLNARTGIKFRLPSKMEWEYACLANSTTSYHFGNTISNAMANYNSEYQAPSSELAQSLKGPSRVMSYSPNRWGLYDMHGNVYEWTSTRYPDESPFESFYIKGGSWAFGAKRAETCNQVGHGSKDWGYSIGFRLAADANQIIDEVD